MTLSASSILCTVVGLVGVSVTLASAVEPNALPPDLQRAEETRRVAIATGDMAALDQVLDDMYVEVDIRGHLHDRAQALSIDPASTDVDHLLARVRADVAVIVGRASETRVLRVWVRRYDRWRLASQQAVSIDLGKSEPEPPAPISRPQSAFLPDSVHSVTSEVLQAQDALDRANTMNDPEMFIRLTDPDFVVVTNRGFVRTKADRVIEERVARLESRPHRPMPTRDSLAVRVFGTVAIVTARNWPRTYEGLNRPPVRYTRIWVRNSGTWQQLANIPTTVRAPLD